MSSRRSFVLVSPRSEIAGGGVAVLALLGLTLRPALTSVGALLGRIQTATGLSPVLAAVVVATPLVCFAVGGWLAWVVRRRFGAVRAVTGALGVAAASLAYRVAGGPLVLWLGTVTVSLGIAVLATLLPAIVKSAPARRRRLTTAWTTALGAGSAAGALCTPPLAAATSWSVALAAWALPAGAALVAWLVAAPRPGDHTPVPRPAVPRLRPRLPAVALTVHFGLLSGASFTIMGWLSPILADRAGASSVDVAWMYGTSMTVGVLVAPFVPSWAARLPDQSAMVAAFAGWSLLGTAGLLVWPAAAPWLWSGLIGMGMPAVVLALTLISLRTTGPSAAAALSSVVNATGYGLACVVALAVGLLHAATGAWTSPLAALLVVLAGQAATGFVAGRPALVGEGGPA
ncbi:MAG TPA: MFS transporter [Actinophytocola sp.]|nr:MFS transporter [Actinophytocola sp.]